MMKTNTKLITIALLSLLAGGILGGAGVYLWQQNSGSADDQLAENPQLLQVCKELAGGNTQALLDVMAIQLDEYYLVHSMERYGESTGEQYNAMIRDGMDAAYAYYFEGKDIEVRPMDMTDVIVPSFSGTESTFSPMYMYEFYEDDQLLLTMTFSQVTDGKYEITEEYAWEEDGTTEMLPSFTSAVLPMNGFYPDFHLALQQYKNMQDDEDGFSVIGIGGSADGYRDEILEKTRPLYADGWKIVDETMRRDKFDTDVNRWTYTVWFEAKNAETGASCVLEQRFAYSEDYLYPCETMQPAVISESGDVPETVKEVLLNLF